MATIGTGHIASSLATHHFINSQNNNIYGTYWTRTTSIKTTNNFAYHKIQEAEGRCIAQGTLGIIGSYACVAYVLEVF